MHYIRYAQDWVGGHISIYAVGTFLFLPLAVIFGGASRPNIVSNVILAAFGIAYLFSLLPVTRKIMGGGGVTLSLVLLAFICIVPAVQLLPIPSGLMFPRSAGLREDLIALEPELAGAMTLSFSPFSTLQSLGYLALPIALFLSVLFLNFRQRRWVVYLILTLSGLSFFLGLTQVFSGPESDLYFYSVTNRGSPVGFFSNRNHLAALFYCSILFAAPLFFSGHQPTESVSSPSRSPIKTLNVTQHRFAMGISGKLVIGCILIVLMILGIAISTSRAGFALGFLAIALSLVTIWFRSQRKASFSRAKSFILISAIAVLIGAYYGLDLMLTRLSADGFALDSGRSELNSTTLTALKSHFPFGSGFGTFEQIYMIYEPLETMTSSIANRAHNEFLEWILEGGLLSAIGLLFAGFWILDGVYRLWFQSLQADSRLDLLIMRSALFVPVLVLIHSSVDYPMRTLSMACIIAVSCAMTISPLGTSPQFQRGAPPIKYV